MRSHSTFLSPEDWTLLETIASKHSTRAAGMAKSMLTIYGGMSFPEALVHPVDIDKSNRKNRKSTQVIAETNRLSVWPNPPSDYLVVKFVGIDAFAYRIVDTQGRKEQSDAIDSNRSIQLIDLQEIHSGTYTLSLKDEGGNIQISETIVVTK